MVLKPEEEMASPVYPLRVVFGDGDEWQLDNQDEVACNLEWFDSSDPDEDAEVLDALNRPVVLKVERLEVKLLKLQG